MSDWREVSVGELVEIRHGFAFKGEFFRTEPPGDILLTPGNFAIGGGFKGDKLKYYVGPPEEDYVLEPGDLLVTMTDLSKASDTLGFPLSVPTSTTGVRYLHNQRLGKVLIRDDAEVDPQFLYYLLCTREYRHEVVAGATGTTVKHTSPKRISAFRFALPPIDEQRRIAAVLGVLDDKIELNRRMNETLEGMARALFKSWFVDFDPVRAKMEGRQPYGMDADTAALFPDHFEDSELGQIPAGWESGLFGDVARNVRKSVSPDEMTEGDAYIALEHMPRGSIALDSWTDTEGVGSNKSQFGLGQILFGKLRPYFHKVGVAAVAGVCSTDILVIDSEPEWRAFALGHASSRDFVDYATRTSTGTRMPRTNWKSLAKYALPVPGPQVAKRYSELVEPMLAKMRESVFESRTLAELRDTLLPKLLSGELRVPEAEEMVEDA